MNNGTAIETTDTGSTFHSASVRLQAKGGRPRLYPGKDTVSMHITVPRDTRTALLGMSARSDIEDGRHRTPADIAGQIVVEAIGGHIPQPGRETRIKRILRCLKTASRELTALDSEPDNKGGPRG